MVSLEIKRLVYTINRFFYIQKGVFMNLYKYKGKRIRASDKNLVYRFCAGTLLEVWKNWLEQPKDTFGFVGFEMKYRHEKLKKISYLI